jgi:methionyl-tRNA formyltransferase
MRIALIGQAAFGESVLNALVEGGEDVVGVFCPPDAEGRPPDPLKAAAESHGVPVFQYRRLRDQSAIDAFAGMKSDLSVMAFVTDIVPEAILQAPSLGTIQYHPSLLPRHRGPSSINWPIIQGESITGLTVFWPDSGLDTGPILLQREVEITSEDTLGSLYFNKLFPAGVDAMVEAVGMVKDGSAPRLAQDESQATYEGWCRAEDVVIDWAKPIREIYNLVKGGDPSPGANTTLNGDRIGFYRAGTREDHGDGAPGEVVEISSEGFEVAAEGGTLLIGRVQPESSRKLAAAEWAESAGLTIGARFGS